MGGNQSLDELVRQAQGGTEDERRQILDQLFAQFAAAAYRWAVMVLNDEAAAYDAVQDAWLSAYLHLGELRESVAFPAWFRQIVVTSCYHVLRKSDQGNLSPSQLLEDLADDSDPVDAVEDKERLEHIREAVLSLPEGEREVTELYYFADYPQQEIAEVLGIPITTVKKRLQYAREHLRGLIQRDMVAHLNLDIYALEGGCTIAAFGDILSLTVPIADALLPLPDYLPQIYSTPPMAALAYP